MKKRARLKYVIDKSRKDKGKPDKQGVTYLYPGEVGEVLKSIKGEFKWLKI